jgi:ABC-2 type transport system ATP-binding protein
VILESGRVLAAGSLAELRRELPAQLRIKVDGPEGWTRGLRGVSVERSDADGVVLVMQPGTDPQTILQAALAAGPVEHFGFESGGLLELYRRMVAP